MHRIYFNWCDDYFHELLVLVVLHYHLQHWSSTFGFLLEVREPIWNIKSDQILTHHIENNRLTRNLCMVSLVFRKVTEVFKYILFMNYYWWVFNHQNKSYNLYNYAQIPVSYKRIVIFWWLIIIIKSYTVPHNFRYVYIASWGSKFINLSDNVNILLIL